MVIGSKQHADLRLTLCVEQAGQPRVNLRISLWVNLRLAELARVNLRVNLRVNIRVNMRVNLCISHQRQIDSNIPSNTMST